MVSPLNKSFDSMRGSFTEMLEILDPESTGYIDIEDLVKAT